MISPKIFATRLSGYAALTMSADEDLAYPMTNLTDANPLLVWRHSSAEANAWLQVDFGQDAMVDFMLVDTHNLNLAGYKLEYDVTPEFNNPVAIVGETLPETNGVHVCAFPEPVAARVIRITFTNAVQATIGNLFFGKAFTFRYPFAVGATEGDAQYVTAVTTSLSGITRTSQAFDGRRVWEYQWNLLDNSDAADLKLLFAYVRGRLLPFYLQYQDSFDPVLVYLDADASPVPRGKVYNQNATSKMRFLEWKADAALARFDRYAGQSLVGSVPLVGE